MFGRYRLEISGTGSPLHNVYCDLEFLSPTTDTSNIDTIPVFVIDSYCFEGTCLDSSFCRRPGTYWDDVRESLVKGKKPYHKLLIGDDLNFGLPRGLWPNGFHFSDTLVLSETCKDRDVSVVINARLFDRVSGKEIARESKRVQFRISKRWVWFLK